MWSSSHIRWPNLSLRVRNLYPLRTKLRSKLKGLRKKISKAWFVRRTLRFFIVLT